MENNIFTPRIVDLILPGCSIESKGDQGNDDNTIASKSTNFISNASGSMNLMKDKDTDTGS